MTNSFPVVHVDLDGGVLTVQTGVTIYGRIIVLDQFGYPWRVEADRVEPVLHGTEQLWATTSIENGKLVLDALPTL